MRKLKNRFASAFLAAALTVTGAPMTLLAQDQTVPMADEKAAVLDLNEKTTARYSSVRITFTAETSHTYKIQKKNSSGTFEDLEGASALTTGSFIDENAGTGEMPTYKIVDVTNPDQPQETAEFTSVKTGLEALAAVSALAWTDPQSDGQATVFDGTNTVQMDAQTVAKVAALNEGTVIAKVQLNSGAVASQSGAFLGIKSGNNNRYFGYRSSSANSLPFAFGYELTDTNKINCLGSNTNNWSLQAGENGHTVVYRAPADCVADRLTYFYDGADGLINAAYPNIFKDQKFNGFLTKTTPMDAISIGGVTDANGTTAAYPWKGTINYVLITSELLSEDECAAVSSANADIKADEIPDLSEKTDGEQLQIDEALHARYSTVRISFTPEAGHTYRIQKKNEDGTFSDLEGATALTTGSFIDENAGLGKTVTYKIIDNDTKQETAELISKETGLKSLAEISTLCWIDPKTGGVSTVFDGTNVISVDAATTAKLAAMTEGTVIARAKHSSDLSSTGGAFLGIKSGSADRFFGYRNNSGSRAVFGYELADQNKCQCMGTNANNWDLAAGNEAHTVIYRSPANCLADRLTYFYDGADGLVGAQYPDTFKNSKFNGFLTKTTPFNTAAIGGVKDASGNVTRAWKGEIDYVLVTSELLTEAECAALSAANENIDSDITVDPTPDPVEVECTVKGGVFKNTITWNGGGTAKITRDGKVVAEAAVSPYKDVPGESGSHTYDIVVTTDGQINEFSRTISTGLEETSVLYHDFKKDTGTNPTVFDGTRLPYNFLEGADDALKTRVGKIGSGAVVIRFKSNTTSNPYNLFFAHKAGVYAQAAWPADNAVGAIEGRVQASKKARFDLTGGAKAELGSVADGQWHTIAFSSTDADHMSEADTFCLTLDGSKVFSYPNNSSFAGLFTRLGGAADEVLIGGVRKSAGTDASSFAGLFNGEIDYAAIVDEPLSNEELIELTKADEAPLTKNQLFDTSGNKHWVAAGGGLASTGNDILGYSETYYKLFHLNISLDHNANGGYDLANFNRQRYVINRSIPGNTIKDIDEQYDSLINKYGPRSVLLMLDGNESLSDQQIKDSLKSILTKNIEAKRFTLLQIPPVKGDASRDLKALVDAVIAADFSTYGDSIVVVDHEALFKAAGEDEKSFDANGNLNARGHLLICNQLGAAVGVGDMGTANLNTLNKYSFTPLAPLKEETPIFTVSSDSVRASIQADGTCYGVLEVNGQKTKKPFANKAVVFNGLKPDTAFDFTIVNQDGAVVYKKKTGRTGTSSVTDAADYDQLTDLQKLVKQYTTQDEQTTWLFVGDSITHGVYTDGFTGVPDVFERYVHDDLNRPNDVVINGGISNADFGSYFTHKDERYDRWKDEADVVICMLGTNDGAYGPSEGNHWLYTDYKQHLSDAVKEWKADGKVVVLRVPPKIVNQAHAGHIGRNDDIHRWVKEVAEEQGCILVDHFDLFDEKQKSDEKSITSTGFWFNHSGGKDGIHPVGPGQIAMAKQVIQEMGIFDSNSRIARQDMAEPVTSSESLKNTKLVLDAENRTVSYNLSALETELGKTVGEAELTVTKGTTTISKKLIRKEAASLSTISVDLQDLFGDVQASVTVRTTDSWNGSTYNDQVVAKETLKLGGEHEVTYDLTALQKAHDDAVALAAKQDTLLPQQWKTYLTQKANAAKAGLDNPVGTFNSQAEVDAAAANLDSAVSKATSASNAYKALDANKDLDLSRYTDETASAYTAAKKALEDYMAGTITGQGPDSASKTQIDTLLKSYTDAKDALTEKPAEPTVDTTALRMLLTDIGDIDLSEFRNPDNIHTRFSTALETAKNALTSKSQKVIDDAVTELHLLWLDLRLEPKAEKLK